jgi:hypothetical protein
MKILRSEEGQLVVFTALGMVMLAGCVALAVDVSLLFRAKRQAQIAADAAAIAGALELRYNGTTNVQTNAVNAALTNGMTNSNQVTVSTSGGGNHTGFGFVQVVVQKPNPTFFMSLFGRSSVDVGARAVAGITPDPNCSYVLDPHLQGALTGQGKFTVNSAGCGWAINSDSNLAVCVTGGSGTFNAPSITVRSSGLTTGGNCNNTLSTPTFTGAANVTDPLGGITGPVSPNWTGCGSTSAVTQIQAGDPITSTASGSVVCFTNQVLITGSTTVNLTGAATYVFEQGVEIDTGTTVNSNGTFDIAGGSLPANGGGSCIGGGGGNKTGFKQDSKSSLNITAPASGFSAGLAIMEPTGVTLPLEVQFGSNTSSSNGSGLITGLIYAPSAAVYLHDNGGSASATGMIADTVTVCSSTLNITSYNNTPGNNSPLNSIQLVE